jgi:Domain of unknown function (DUF4288)
MTRDSWFAASVVMAVLIEDEGLARRATSVVLLRAEDFDAAFEAALVRGAEMEESYENRNGQGVRWAFEGVETLDMLPEELSDGVEVYVDLGADINDATVPFDRVFEPAKSPPGQSGVPPT